MFHVHVMKLFFYFQFEYDTLMYSMVCVVYILYKTIVALTITMVLFCYLIYFSRVLDML